MPMYKTGLYDTVHKLLPVYPIFHMPVRKTGLYDTVHKLLPVYPIFHMPVRKTGLYDTVHKLLPVQQAPATLLMMNSKEKQRLIAIGGISLTEEAICPICLDFFTDPVILECGHNFCRSCITRCWEREERNSCPECREEFADRSLRVNRALANLSEKARKLNLNPKEKEKKLHCEEHEEELKLFCETDKTLICLICRDSREHKSHDFLPINEAVEVYKDRVKSSLDSLTKRKSDFEEMEQQQKEKISGVREQSHSLQSQITSHFAELHRVLAEREQRTLRDIREEEERILNPMEKNLREIHEHLNSIQEEISKLQEWMDQKDSVMFLMEEAHWRKRINHDEQTLSVTDGALLVEKLYHPYLFNLAFGDKFGSIKPVSVTLDVEMAHPKLEVSEDRKSKHYGFNSSHGRRVLSSPSPPGAKVHRD
ncbi:nuclear factor 7, brain-like [Hemitrygon akajei]|uniref:nuclear factor 7, brain-like n=1 Tax=Hemitrygon akajei TaxID=2704970 RepID=UPI003BF9FEFC